MLKPLAEWLDARTGYRKLLHEALDEPIPGGARWRYVFGSALTGTFMIQLVTGVFLMTSYSPSSSTAWGSVWYITNRMNGGWFLRGLHHFGSQAMVILLVLHLLQVVIAGAYRAPREINWWFGLLLMGVTLGFSLTGYLLPWDQKGFWATKVATKIASGAPVIGPAIEKVIVGGDDYGNQTLTRFYGLHVGVFPGLLVLFLVAHVALFRKHGVTAPRNARGVDTFWPKQVFFDTVAVAIVFCVLAFFAWREFGSQSELAVWLRQTEYGRNLVWEQDTPTLEAPADPGSAEYPARPEWYFLSLFQLLKKFPGKYEFVGTMIVPGAIATVLLLLPLIGRILPRGLAHFLACSFVFLLVGGAGYLTIEAFQTDKHDVRFQQSRRAADDAARRAVQLAEAPNAGIPPSGAGDLLKLDPKTRGRELLTQKCLGCHSYGGETQMTAGAPYKGMDLKGYASRPWIFSLLNDPTAQAFTLRAPLNAGDKFGAKLGGMAEWKRGSELDSPEKMNAVAAFVATFSRIPEDMPFEEWVTDPKIAKHRGYEGFVNECLRCHTCGNLGDDSPKQRQAPSLFAYGSPRWTKRMIKNPAAQDLYGFLKPHRQMPGFADQLSATDLEMIVRCLTLDYAGGNPGGMAEPVNPR